MSGSLLLARAKTALFNQSEVTQELCDRAWAEAVELTRNKPIPTAMLLDLAFMRLKLYLKIEVDETESKLAFLAIKEAEKLSAATSGGGTAPAGIKVNKRVSEWDM